jgi:hypothetical protein
MKRAEVMRVLRWCGTVRSLIIERGGGEHSMTERIYLRSVIQIKNRMEMTAISQYHPV